MVNPKFQQQEDKMGQIYQGRKGEYTIIQEFPGKQSEILVEYVSGPWKDRQVRMSRSTHNTIQENIRISEDIEKDLEKQDTTQKLDLWYQKYPNLYKSLWYEGITGLILLEKLSEEYPEASSNIDLEVSKW